MDSHGKGPTLFGRTLSEISAAIRRFQGSLYQPPQTTSDTTDWPSPWGPTDSEAAEIEKRTREARIRAHEEHAYTATLQDLGTNGPSGPQFEGNEVTAKGAETNQEKVAMPGNVPSGTDLNARSWEDIDIVFLSELKVQITINSQLQPPQNYAEMGFENKKNKNPVAAWETLRELAQHGGVCRVPANGKRWGQIEKRMQEIRKAFQRRFALSNDPIPFRKKTPQNPEDFGYRTRFSIRCHPAFDA